MRLGLIANPKRPETIEARERVFKIAEQMGFRCSASDDTAEILSDDPDVLVVIGGDGSVIRAAHIACRKNIPLLGLHFGRVGFLTELSEETFPDALMRLKTGDYRETVRTMLDVRVNDGEARQCLNDVLVYKHSFSGVTQMYLSVDRNAIGTLFGDGVVIATPTGATGYSLSARGPIVADGLEAMLLTPICPHTLHMRPVVASMDSTIKVTVSDNCFVAADGDMIAKLNRGDVLLVSRSDSVTRILTFTERNPFRLLAEKLS